MKRLSVLLAVLMMWSHGVAADPYVPPALEEWQEWVLHQQETIECPLLNATRLCVWPGRLHLDVDARGAKFRQSIEVYSEHAFVLPGGLTAWPLDVSVDGTPVPVLARGNRPYLLLSPGKHTIDGVFQWSKIPDQLALDNTTGMVALRVDGKNIERPRWNRNSIWIQQNQSQVTAEAENQISTSVYRRLFDGAPTLMDIRLQLEISGESREEVIGRLVPAGFTPATMSAPLPARLDDEGNLKIQARPGTWTFTFQARSVPPLQQFKFEPSGEYWPTEEIWSYMANPALRATEVQAANPVDPVQTGVPAEWHNIPAFRMTAGDEFVINERQRGRSAAERNRLTLNRALWMDFDRGGYTARDQIGGSMLNEWRLNMHVPFELQSAEFNSKGQRENLLVTKFGDDASMRGVEVRSPVVTLEAISRLEERQAVVPVGGWDTRFDQVSTTLFLPPGHRLLAASGVDYDADSWASQWNLLDFFLVLIVTVAVWRLFAPWLGVVALVALTLSLHESGAPQWAWLNLLVALSLVKYLPKGRANTVARVYSGLSVFAIIVILLPFASNQLRAAVFPQLEEGRSNYSVVSERSFNAPAPESEIMIDGDLDEISVTGARRAKDMRSVSPISVEDTEGVTSSRVIGASKRNVLNRYGKNARIQTGPGLPNWSWHQYRLTWSGPVEIDQTTRLWIVPPLLLRLWRLGMVAMIGLFLAVVLMRSLKLPRINLTAGAAPLLAVLALAMVFTSNVPVAQAELPDQNLLQQLRDRLLESDECKPYCLDVSRARVTIDVDQATIEMIVHAQTLSVVKLPGVSGGWMPETISVNGQANDSLRIADDNTAQLQLSEGVHRIVLHGSLPNANSVGIAFPMPPHYIQVDSQGWEVTGVNDNRLSGGALTLIRQQDGRQRSSLDAIDVEQFPAFVEIDRRLNFDLDWSVTTVVSRRTPQTAAINLRVPLLPGESVTEDFIEVKDGHALITIATGASRVSWTSNLARVPQLQLTAMVDQPWQERWSIEAGATWRLQHQGVPELNVDRNRYNSWVAQFLPWPGETLSLELSRPAAVQGETMAVDLATLNRTVAKRSSNSTLNFSYRATRGSQHPISLPANSELSSVVIDGQSQNLSLEQGQLRLPVTPGSHQVQIEWRTPSELGFHTKTETVDLGVAASNISNLVSMPRNRWILWTHGPQLGPAVLYWSELLVLLLVSFALSKAARTPLKFVHWLLLGLGFSTFFWPALVIVAVAMLGLAWRQQHVIEQKNWFNVVQVALVGIVVASLIALITAIPFGLLGTPDMHVTGNSSSAYMLRWFVDRTSGVVPQGGVFSLPLWVYKGLILVWALWLALALMKWLPWMWQSFSHGGYWKSSVAAQDNEPPTEPVVIDDQG